MKNRKNLDCKEEKRPSCQSRARKSIEMEDLSG